MVMDNTQENPHYLKGTKTMHSASKNRNFDDPKEVPNPKYKYVTPPKEAPRSK